jgi:hypothetical protein
MSNGFIILVTIGKKGRFWCLSGIGGLSGRESRWASVVAAALYERIGPSEYRRPLKQSEKRPGGGVWRRFYWACGATNAVMASMPVLVYASGHPPRIASSTCGIQIPAGVAVRFRCDWNCFSS